MGGGVIGFKILLIFCCGVLFLRARTEPIEDKQALLYFANNSSHSRPLNWDVRTSACNYWVGVTCNHDQSRIIAVRLPGFGFRGSVPPNTLSRLSELQILSLRSNAFTGPFPSDLAQLRNLTSLYLQFNRFQGPLPENFSVWENLSVLNLSGNAFNGTIPSSISNLTHLTTLILSNNSFSGDIPDLNIPSLQLLDLSHNKLTGNVPPSLSRFPSSAFSDNNLNNTHEVSVPPVLPPIEPPKKHSSRLSGTAILGIIIGACAVGFALIAVLLIFCYTNKETSPQPKLPQRGGTFKKDKNAVSGSHDGDGRLIFFEGCSLAFDLEDLLRASAEVLGKGSFGTTYKAALEDANIVAVKRLKEVTVGKREFELQMEVVGNLRHENVAPLRAYYYSKDEKLMVYDYYSQGSVSALLHAKRGEKRIPLDWETRVRIAVGAARGIAHLHQQSSGKLVHGNIKASNIFLNSQQYGCVSDLGLATLMNPVAPPVIRTAGYRAPEVTDTRKASQASDVYSFGVLLLELLTGKSPIHQAGSDEVIHLVRWVHSVVREEWTAEVFDIELLRYPNIEEEMVEMLQIGMTCVTRMPDQRPKMIDVVKMVEDIRRVNTGNRPSTDGRTEESTLTLTPSSVEMASSSIQQ
ncbi:OLC1v1027577C1 [Oldenlandia corymbosa var. corymbosa]|uniref:OLC1v1027577C1 n=1 Tax=Oldenlandia corymbosa var. corymbosa TaxID=529605 RepID=A0AAV1CAZ0_OLDCO|nr:OLC1v1027577C1 [Oldenlandia corymbosa var. corymbosa]